MSKQLSRQNKIIDPKLYLDNDKHNLNQTHLDNEKKYQYVYLDRIKDKYQLLIEFVSYENYIKPRRLGIYLE